MNELLRDYERRLFSDKGRAVFKTIPPLNDAFWAVGEKNVQLISQGQKDQAFEFLVKETIPARNALLNGLESAVEYVRGTDARYSGYPRRSEPDIDAAIVCTQCHCGVAQRLRLVATRCCASASTKPVLLPSAQPTET